MRIRSSDGNLEDARCYIVYAIHVIMFQCSLHKADSTVVIMTCLLASLAIEGGAVMSK